MSLHVGERFADYTVLQRLGTGGMGEVYLAQHPRLPRRDALKVLPAHYSNDSQFRQRFLREADIAASLMHPNVVSVHDRGDHAGRLWIAMDFVQGCDGAELVRQRYPAGMPLTECYEIVAAVASALDYAHVRGLLHRDVKPANILLTDPDGRGRRRVYLTDFGIARKIDDTSGLTGTDMTVGTFAYAAPEQVMGLPLDGRVDQYALAGTAFYLLSGAAPFEGSSAGAIMMAHVNAPRPSIGRLRPDLAALDAVFAKAMAKDALDRFSNCEEFASALAGSLVAEHKPGGWQRPREGVLHGEQTQLAMSADMTRLAVPEVRREKAIPVEKPRKSAEPPGYRSETDLSSTRERRPYPRSFWRRPWVIAAGAVLALAILGTGIALVPPSSRSSTIKPDGAAQSVVDLVSEKTDFKPTDVKCPDGVEAEVGGTFDCTFTGPDGDYLAHMKIDKIDGEQVLFDINTELKK
jgi:serine/threonine protein kinase